MQTNVAVEQVSLFDPDSGAGRMCPAPTAAREGETSKPYSRSSYRLKNQTFMLLDLRPGAGNLLGPYWEIDPVWLGPPGTLNSSACPKGVVESSLSQILVAIAPSKYYLTPAACRGILRRAEERGKKLPPLLERALQIQAGLIALLPLPKDTPTAFSINQRKEVRDLRDKSAALTATTGMEMQTFITQRSAGFVPEASAEARSIGYQEETAPTLKAGGKSGAVMLPTLCLNDQGGSVMDCSEEVSGTLRAQEHGHQPLVFSNHGQGTRYGGPIQVATTVTAGYGAGGNNTPFVTQDVSYCIVGNIIDRQVQNGGNGTGVNEEVAFTLTASDHHAVFGRQRTDLFKPADVASTESARQYKDATDLVLDGTYQETVGSLCQSDKHGIGSQYVSQDKCIVEMAELIRRLLPVECERLQGFPDGWTNLPGASDSARYKALGNSVAIPCVELLMLGIALVLHYRADQYATVEALCKILWGRNNN